MSLFQLKPSEVRKSVVEAMEVNLVPFISSSPGLGKSSIIAQIAKDFGLQMIDLRLSQCAPEDLMGLPMRQPNGKATFAPFETFPLAGDPLPKGMNGWILNLDEFNSAPKSVQAAAYKIVLDRMVGQEKLHPDCHIVAAGNLATDRAIVTTMSTAMQSRLVHLEMVYDHKDFMAYAIPNGFDNRITGFLEFQPSKGHSFKPDHQDKTFACPRTWEFSSRLIKGKSVEDINLPLLAGTISDGVATECHTFMKEYDKIPSFGAICADPLGLEIPPEASTRYAVSSMLMDKFTKPTFEDVIQYVRRMPPEFQVIYFRGLLHRNPEMRREKTYNANIKHLVRFLNDDDDESADQPAMASNAA